MAPRRNKVKPFDPAAAERAKIAQRQTDFDAVGLQPEAAALESHADIQTTRAGEMRGAKRVDSDTARRLDVFETLRPSMDHAAFVGAYDAARRLERDILISLGQHDHGRPVDRVDCEQAAYSRVDAMIDASKRTQRVRNRLAPRDTWLLWELIAPSRPWTSWRATVAHITAETNPNAQGAAVRAVCVNLRDAYQALEIVVRKAA